MIAGNVEHFVREAELLLLPMAVPGVISCLCGIMLLCAPEQLLVVTKKRAMAGRHVLETDTVLLRHRLSAGICFLAIGAFCLSSALYVWMRLHP